MKKFFDIIIMFKFGKIEKQQKEQKYIYGAEKPIKIWDVNEMS